MKKFNSICKIIAVVSAIICVLALGALYIDSHFVDHGINALVFDENDEYTGVKIKLPEFMESGGYCRLWPTDQPLDLSGKYWTYSTDFDQWIRCTEEFTW